jgi:hypothetical protein
MVGETRDGGRFPCVQHLMVGGSTGQPHSSSWVVSAPGPMRGKHLQKYLQVIYNIVEPMAYLGVITNLRGLCTKFVAVTQEL